MKKIIAALSLLLSTAGAVAAQDGQVRVVITPHGNPRPDLVKDAGGEVVLESPDGKFLVARMPLARVASLRAHDAVAAIEEDQPVTAFGGPPVAPPAGQVVGWNMSAIKADQAWAIPVTGAGITVAIIDTGIQSDHPDLKSRVVLGPNYVNSKKTASDDNGHGTHCAGIVGASNNSIGVVGVAPGCTLLAVKVLDRNGSGYLSAVAAGIKYAVASGAKVLSLSLGGAGSSTLEAAVVDASPTAVICAAAGNDGPAINTVSYPGAYDQVICVASTDKAGLHSSFSTSGYQVDVAAPGSGILSTYLNGGYATLSGTSMATPHVAGAAALLFSNGSTQAATVRANLENSASLVLTGRTDQLGYGLIDVVKALGLPK